MISLIFKNHWICTVLAVLWLSSNAMADAPLLTSIDKLWIKKNAQLSFAGDPDWLPFEAINAEGEYVGIVSDYLKFIKKKTGLSFVLRPTKSWNETLELSKDSKLDIISGDIADAVLNQNYRPIAPYYIDPIVVLMPHKVPYSGDVSSLKDKKVAIVEGYGYTADLYKNYPELKLIGMQTVTEALNALNEAKVDVLLISSSIAQYRLRKMNLTSIHIVGKTSVTMEVTLFVKKSEKVLRNILDKTVKHMSVATRSDIANFWIHNIAKKDKFERFLMLGLILLTVLILFLIFRYKKLEKSKEFLEHAIDSSVNTVWHYDVSNDIMRYSEELKNMLDYKDEELGSNMENWSSKIHPDDKFMVHAVMEHNKEIFTKMYMLEYRIICGHTWTWLSVRMMQYYNEASELSRIDGFFSDITEDKKREQAHIEKNKVLESAQEIGHLGSWTWNISTGEISWTDEVYRIFGEIPQSFPASYDAFISYIPKEYRPGLESAIEKAVTEKIAYEYDHEIIRKDGTRCLVREAGYAHFDSEGKATDMFGTVLDINAFVEVISAKKENVELNELLDKYDENVIASNTNLAGVITYASRAFSRISGFGKEELMGSSQNIVRHPDTSNEVFKQMWKTLGRSESWSGELKNMRKDGSFYWVYNTISPIFDELGQKTGYSAIRHDITHEKAAQALQENLQMKSEELITLNQELEQRIIDAVNESKGKDNLIAQQSKLASMGEMIGNIAHQWRQPLNALGLLLQKQEIFFNKGILTQEKMHDGVEKGNQLIQKMSTTIDDFRDFFKPNKEKIDFSIKESVEETLSLIDSALYNQNIQLDIAMDADSTVHGYKNEFSQVVLNLVNNAKDAFSPQQQQCWIKLESFIADGKIVVEVSDNAGGIPIDIIENIFEPYFTTKEEGKGTGIGLYMSKMIIEENMHGSLHVENKAEGASFSILLDASKT